ncbi:MAG: hypothetical protein OHK0023_00590 [Anaerolineae bacterium]
MSKNTNLVLNVLTARHLIALAQCSPEGFFHRDQLADPRLAIPDQEALITAAVSEGKLGLVGDYLFDTARLTAERVLELSTLYDGALPALKADGTPAVRPILERLAQRERKASELGMIEVERILAAFENTPGYLRMSQLLTQPNDELALTLLLSANLLKQMDDLIFDPLRITRPSLEAIFERHLYNNLKIEVLQLVDAAPSKTMQRADLVAKFGAKTVQKVIESGALVLFSVQLPMGESFWVHAADADPAVAYQTASDAVLPKDEDWQAALDAAGSLKRSGARDGATRKEQVIARSYTLLQAARKLGIRTETLQNARAQGIIPYFVDPDHVTRISAADVEAILRDVGHLESIEGYEMVSVRDLRLALHMEADGDTQLRNALRQLRKEHATQIRWSSIREVLFDAPPSLRQFREWVKRGRALDNARVIERRAEERRLRVEEREKERLKREKERHERDQLRERLLAAFPTWLHSGRADQQVILHVGPTNSGKTHHALEALKTAGRGWYLAPLRLLAFEIFDRLNREGVRCNLLTGEEHIPVPDATITAATIEMFNPQESGDCVVIDEAHMLADPDRGWAWTRALMECQAPEIRVIAPPFARDLIERLTQAAAIPLRVAQHQRLTPLEISTHPWTLENLPDKTILVAFSRRMVLRLKTELEKYQRRVSVIYGNLPPEVRRKQADRFADGQTEICVATDAVGMGLNLPANNVCFYEMEKFDGKNVRALHPHEVHQIAGRAGRYGYSEAGLVGTTTRANLKLLRRLMEVTPPALQMARVSPGIEDLQLIPGTLSRRLAQWRELQSIPEALRHVIEPADIDERIALAAMLTDREVEQLGLAAAVQLINAPTRENTRMYWYQCAKAILAGRPMPLPMEAPMIIENDRDLEATEESISSADIYLWLSCRHEFAEFGPSEDWLRALRAEWSMSIDAALLQRLDTAARCINCRRRLPLNHRYPLCDTCYSAGRYSRAGRWG